VEKNRCKINQKYESPILVVEAIVHVIRGNRMIWMPSKRRRYRFGCHDKIPCYSRGDDNLDIINGKLTSRYGLK
jgi:hypothetical protein